MHIFQVIAIVDFIYIAICFVLLLVFIVKWLFRMVKSPNTKSPTNEELDRFFEGKDFKL